MSVPVSSVYGGAVGVGVCASSRWTFPYRCLTEVRQKLRLLVWHIDALRLRLEAVQTVPQAVAVAAVAYCFGACKSIGRRCGRGRGRCATASSSADGHTKGAWRDIVIVRLTVRFLWDAKEKPTSMLLLLKPN